MNQIEQHLYNGSRWVLHHGTSTARLKRILDEIACWDNIEPLELQLPR